MDQDSFRRFWRQKGAKIWPLISRYKLQQKKKEKKCDQKLRACIIVCVFFQKKNVKAHEGDTFFGGAHDRVTAEAT